eukprot:TRINITY_DN30993_c0_g1_i1.p1 TRINITY_DN30993_c0_g1~~TRINITY_DN30993_c0_g1_i1.p1  ORF type:complete len:205 (-),score=43.90 TRINITY_DN30993_c0_g1_i1:199-813(-)
MASQWAMDAEMSRNTAGGAGGADSAAAVEHSAESMRTPAGTEPVQLAQPVPGPMTPLVSPGAEEEDELMSVDIDVEATGWAGLRMLAEQQACATGESACKRLRCEDDRSRIHGGFSRQQSCGGASGASTQASTPVFTHAASPSLSPSLMPLEMVNYRKMSETELRANLGVTGTCITEGWDKDELVAVAEELDRMRLTDMADLEL